MKRVILLLPNLAAGGAERVTITIARLLEREGYNVEFLNFGAPEGEMLSWIVPEFKLTSLGFSRTLQALPALTRFMKSHRDCIFFSSREHVNLVSLIASKRVKAEVVVRVPNMPLNKLSGGISGLKMRVIKALNKYLFKGAKVIIAQNEEMRRQLLDYYSLPRDLVKAINNPVDREYVVKMADGMENPLCAGGINFVNVCNIAYSKGIDVLMKAWPKVKESLPDAKMYIVGRDTSDYAVELKRKAKDLADFHFVGFKSNPYPYLKNCDAFVLPSRMEGFPNVVLEAICFDRPVASTTCVEVIKDIIKPGVNGYYCDIEDSDALAECMLRTSCLKESHRDYNLFDKFQLLNCFK